MFTSTDAEEKDNWLGDWGGYAIYSNTSVMMGVLKAGYSVATGFFVFQMIQNFLVSSGEAWTDIAAADFEEDEDGRRIIRLKTFEATMTKLLEKSTLDSGVRPGTKASAKLSRVSSTEAMLKILNPLVPLTETTFVYQQEEGGVTRKMTRSFSGAFEAPF